MELLECRVFTCEGCPGHCPACPHPMRQLGWHLPEKRTKNPSDIVLKSITKEKYRIKTKNQYVLSAIGDLPSASSLAVYMKKIYSMAV
jgi:hypothetical protein